MYLKNRAARKTRETGVRLEERREAEEALRKSREILNFTQELTKVGGWEWDIENQCMFWTDEVYRIHGFRREEIRPGAREHIDRSIECYDPADRPVILSAFRRCCEHGEPYDLEFPFSTIDGRRIWIRTTAVPVTESGRVVRVVGNIMDITDRKKTEMSLRESRRRLATLLGNLNGLVYRCRNDRDWTMEFVSEGCEALTGYPAGDLLGNRVVSYAQVIQSQDRERIWEEVQAALEKKAPFQLSYRIRTRAGAEKWVWEQGCGVFSDEGTLEALEGFIVDVTERRRAEEALLEEKAFSETAVNCLPGIFYLFDESGRMLRWNRNLETLTGYSSAEVEVMNPLDFFGEDRGRIMQAIQEVFASGKSDVEAGLVTKDGRKIPFFFTGMRFLSDGRPYLVGMGVDISARKRAEEEIGKLNLELEERVRSRTAELETANRELEAFSYSVSHDLRAPLRAVAGFTEILRRDYGALLDAEGMRVCSVISDNTKRMGQLIDELLTLSRFSRMEMRLASVDMRALAVSAFEELVAPETRGRVDFRVDDLGRVNADAMLIRQVLVNLVSNALKFSSHRERPSISVTRRDERERAVFCVRDNGVGFNMRYADKLFKVFQRLHGEKEFAGTGVGLAIVQRVVGRHGGRTWAEGETDKGASFFFSLPK
jgi:PAS domain S-box-containing protein